MAAVKDREAAMDSQAPPTYSVAASTSDGTPNFQQPQPRQAPYYPPDAPQQPPMQMTGAAQTAAATPLANLGSSSAPVMCPKCSQMGMTSTHFESGGTTLAWGAGACLVACLGCIPYFINGTKDVVHKCGKCGERLATWHRSGRTEVQAYGMK